MGRDAVRSVRGVASGESTCERARRRSAAAGPAGFLPLYPAPPTQRGRRSPPAADGGAAGSRGLRESHFGAVGTPDDIDHVFSVGLAGTGQHTVGTAEDERGGAAGDEASVGPLEKCLSLSPARRVLPFLALGLLPLLLLGSLCLLR